MKKPSIENAVFRNDAPIVIRRAAAGGFVIETHGEEFHRSELYAACSTADETASLIRDMLSAGEAAE